MTSYNTTRSPARGLGMHGCAADSAQEVRVAALLPKRTVGASFWPAPDRPVTSPPHPDLLLAVLAGLRRLDSDGGPR